MLALNNVTGKLVGASLGGLVEVRQAINHTLVGSNVIVQARECPGISSGKSTGIHAPLAGSLVGKVGVGRQGAGRLVKVATGSGHLVLVVAQFA